MKPITSLRKKLKAINKTRAAYETAIARLVIELQDMSGLELEYNDFADDGLGITVSGATHPTYMGIGDLLDVIEEKGTFNEEDIFTYL
jgi:hypothetical protein